MIELENTPSEGAKIRVVGVGGGGGNAINNMINRGLTGVDFIACNTDKQALDHNLAQIKIQIGMDATRGLGAGADPEIGKKAMEESAEEIRKAIQGSDMIFITGGMGGGTGTGGAPILAKVAHEQGSLVVGIVTRPFVWEGKKRTSSAELGISALREFVDALIIIPNQRLLEIIDKKTSFAEAFQKVDEVLYNATKGISDIISNHGVVNVDFADVKTIMKGMGDALMGIGIASGDKRAAEATEKALNSPLLDGISIKGAKGVLVNITGGGDLAMHEVAEVVSIVENATGSDVNLIHGVVYNPDQSDELMVTVVATGFNANNKSESEKHNGNGNTKDEQIELPYKNDGSRHTFGVPKTGRMGSIVDYQIEMSDTVVSPKGTTQLKKYDLPAYERRLGKDALSHLDKGLSKIEKLREKVENAKTDELTDEKCRTTDEKSAFLRKMMD